MDPQQTQQNPGDLEARLTAALTNALAANRPQPPPQQQQPLTQEQIDQMLGTYRPDQTLVELMFGQSASPETRMQALQSLVQGVVANATAHARVINNHGLQEFYGSISPYLEDARALSTDRFWDSLYSGHEGLKYHDPIIRPMLPNFESQADWPQERDARIKYVREKVTPIIKQIHPDFDPVKAPVSPNAGVPGRVLQRVSANGQPSTSGAPLPSMGGGRGGAAVSAVHGGNPGAGDWDKSGFGV